MDDAIAALSAKIDEFVARFDAFLAEQAADIQRAVNEAIAADDAQEAVDLDAMKEKIDGALAKIPPKFDASANG